MIKILLLLISFIIQYTNAGPNLRTSFDPFRQLTNQFLRTVQPDNFALNLSRNLIFNLIDGKPSESNDPMFYVQTYWKTYVGYIILLIIGILFILIFTLVGCIFCCCRVCCKKCGANSANHAAGNIKNKRIAFNVFLFIFSSFILTGAIIAMASNFVFIETVRPINETSDSTGNLFYNIKETVTTLDNFVKALKQNVVTKGADAIRNTLNRGSVLFLDVLNIFIQTFSTHLNYVGLLNSTNGFIALFTRVQASSASLSPISSQHSIRANNFSIYLGNVSSQLADILKNCTNITSCNNVKNQLPNLVLGFNLVNINYTRDMLAGNVSNSYNISDMRNSLELVVSTLNNITSSANTTFLGYINTLIETINKTNITEKVQNFDNGQIDKFLNMVLSFQNQIFSNSSNFNPSTGLYTYVSYAFYGLCALISLILLIVLLFYIGLCYGMCGQPSFEDASRCNKGTGSGFLMAGVAFSFLFGWLMMLVTMILFISGGIVTTEICSYLSTTNEIQLQIVDDIVVHALNKSAIKIGPVVVPSLNYYQSLILRCPKESQLISAFQIPPEFLQNVSTFLYKNYVEGPVNDSISNISNYNISVINTSQLDDSLNNISITVQQLQNIISVATLDELRKPVTNLSSVQGFLDNVTTLINEFKDKNDTNRTAEDIRNVIMNFNTSVTDMDLIQKAYLNQKNASDILFMELNSSLTNVKINLASFKNLPKDARNAAIFASEQLLKTRATQVVNRTLYEFILSIGDCKGLASSFNSAVNTVCVVMLGPYNNIWMGIGWFLLFIIPAIIFAVKLAGIYRISHIESEFSAYNNAYMPSNQFLSANDLEMIRMARPQKA